MSTKLLILGIVSISLVAFGVGMTATGVFDRFFNPLIAAWGGGESAVTALAQPGELDALLPVGRTVRDDDVTAYEASLRLPSQTEVEELTAWTAAHGITLVGIKQHPEQLFNNEFNPETGTVDIGTVNGVYEIYRALSLLPEDVLAIMKGKTIYVSTAAGRPYTVVKGESGGALRNVQQGFIQPQPISRDSVLREVAHLITFQGFQGLGDQPIERYTRQFTEYKSVFNTRENSYSPGEIPPGFISAYATQSQTDNFAEHFRYYVLRPEEFRQKAMTETDLARKYFFLRDHVFSGTEY